MKKEENAPEEIDTPKEVIQYILPMIKGKKFCDLGCGNGKFLKEVSKYCETIGMELYDEDYEKATRKGLKVIRGDIRKKKPPEADVYYNFSYYHDIEPVIEMVNKGILIIGGTPEKFENYPKIVQKGIIIDIPSVNWRLWITQN